MEFKGTKGKWFTKLGEVYSELAEDDELICEFHNYSSKEVQANAILISKAPEMLEMLKKLVDTYELLGMSNQVKQLIKEATEI